MEPNTRRFLRSAVLEALNAEDDRAAMELLNLLTDQPPTTNTQSEIAVLPASRTILEGPAHDYHFWVRFIRESFIPFMTGNGRLRFTSHELMSWLENFNSLPLTAGDIELEANGREIWRCRVSAALQHLKLMGCIQAPWKGRDYLIEQRALPPSHQIQ